MSEAELQLLKELDSNNEKPEAGNIDEEEDILNFQVQSVDETPNPMEEFSEDDEAENLPDHYRSNS